MLLNIKRFTAHILLLMLAFPLTSSQAESSTSSFCELAKLTGGSCVVVDKNVEDFGEIFKNAVLNVLLSTITPTITSVTPLKLPQGSTADLQISAPKAHFNSSSLNDVKIECSGITVNPGGVVLSTSELVVNVTVSVNTAIGFCDVSVTTTLGEGTEPEITKGLKVLQIIAASSQPQVLSITPVMVSRDTSIDMLLYGVGTHFDDSSIVSFGDAGISVMGKTVHNSTFMTLTLKVSSSARTGFHDVTVTTDSEVARESLIGPLQVAQSVNILPTIAQVMPWKGQQGQTLTLQLSGKDTSWVDGTSKVKFSEGSKIDIIATAVKSKTQLTAQVKINADAPLGFRDVYVTTGAESAMIKQGFAVFSPATISLDKNQGQPGAEITLQITGSNSHFTKVSLLDFEDSSITVKSLTITSETQATAVIQIANDATAGTRKFTMVTGTEVAAPLTDEAFKVVIPPPANQAPTNISISKQSVTASSAINTLVGDFSTTDADAGDSHNYTLTDNAGGRFAVSGNYLRVAVSNLASGSYNITVRSTDSGDLSVDKTFPITVTAITTTTIPTTNGDQTSSSSTNTSSSNSTPTPSSPTTIQLTMLGNMEERFVPGTIVGTLNIRNGKSSNNVFTLMDDAEGRFKIVDNNTLIIYQKLTAGSYHITVSVPNGKELLVENLEIPVLPSEKPVEEPIPSSEEPIVEEAVSEKFETETPSGSEGETSIPETPTTVDNNNDPTKDNVPATDDNNNEPSDDIIPELREGENKVPTSIVQFVDEATFVEEYGNTSTTSSGQYVSITVTRTETQGEAKVNYEIMPMTAIPEQDYFPVEMPRKGTLTWVEGDNSPQRFRIFILPDNEVENTEFFTIQLTSANANTVVGEKDKAFVYIKDKEITNDSKETGEETDNSSAIDDNSSATDNCIGKLPLQPNFQEIVFEGEDDKEQTITFTSDAGDIHLTRFVDSRVITMGLYAVDKNTSQLTLIPRKGGSTQLTLADACDNSATVQITVLKTVEEPIVEEVEDECQLLAAAEMIEKSISMAYKSEAYSLTLTEVKGELKLVEAPDGAVVDLELPFYQELKSDIAKFNLTPRGIGSAQLIVEDCTGQQTIVHITVNDEEITPKCTAKLLQSQTFTLALGEEPLTLNIPGGKDARVETMPDPTVITLDLPENGVTPLKLTPRQTGKTKLTIANCLGEATIDITVLKPNTLAHICQSAKRSDGICANVDSQQVISPNTLAINAKGDSIKASAYFEGQLSRQKCSQPNSSATTTAPDDTDSTEATVPPQNCTWEKLANKESIVGQNEPLQVDITIIPDQAHSDQFAQLFLLLAHRLENGTDALFMYDGKSWQPWQLELQNLLVAKEITTLPPIVEFPQSTILLKDLAVDNQTGKFTLYTGYRLQDGTIVFSNPSSLNAIEFWGANSVVYPKSLAEPNAYFEKDVQITEFKQNTRDIAPQSIIINTTLKPASEHLGKVADISIVAIYVNKQGITQSFMRLPEQKWSEWDNDLAHLKAVKSNISLTKNMTVEIFRGELASEMSGKLLIYIGYRLKEGNLVIFNGKEPIEVTMP